MEERIHDLLRAAQESLFLGMRLSKQASYARRAPNPDSLPYFAHAREISEHVLIESPDNREALMILSRISECLLQYDTAIDFLNHAFNVGEPRSKKSLKRLALLRENANLWRDLGLTPVMLRQLGDHLDAEGVDASHRSLRLTRGWLFEHCVEDPEAVISAFERLGAFSDFQVLANVVHG